MYSFTNDYSEGAHENILKALVDTNMEQTTGYGEDIYSERAKDLIKEKINNQDVDIHFVSGGTQANLICISAFLRSHEAALCADTGHINVHETGAIESSGHKVVFKNVSDGKLTKEDIAEVLEIHSDEHMVKPKLVYISNSTEIGTLYNKQELTELSKFCRANDLILYLDGARIGSALMSKENDLTLEDIANLCDAFYIGATKNGGLLGEAIVLCNDKLKSDFRYSIKQKGALLAKGKVLGIQFLELFKEDLFFDLAKHANKMADELSKGIKEAGYNFKIESSTNQIFPIFPNEIIEKLQQEYSFMIWEKYDEKSSVVRLVTSWATDEEKVLEFIKCIKSLSL